MTINEITMHGTRSFHRALNNLQPQEQRRCHKTIKKFNRNLRLGGLNFELLDKGSQHRNHHSIRVSDELRLILGVEPDIQKPQQVVFVYAGHHDAAYRWSENHGWHTGVDSVELYDNVTGRDEDAPEHAKQDKLPFQKFIDMEEWQLFLHPEQEQLVHKKFPREARIVGVAGSGKTVLALHRAAYYLGKTYPNEKVLFTTYSNTLCPHLQSLYQQLPLAAKNVEFRTIDSLMWRFVDKTPIDPTKENGFFDEAYEATIPGTILAKLSPDYLKEEINRVIKGRGASQAEYFDTDRFRRIGRKQGFDRKAREVCWNLKEEWDARLRAAGLTTFADRKIVARDNAQQQDGKYRAVLLDEYQDITLVDAQFLRALVCGSPDNKVPENGLMFFGDVAQRIYAGGWEPAAAKLKFSGKERSQTLANNYRNTRHIFNASVAMRGDAGTGATIESEQTTPADQLPLQDGVRPMFFPVDKGGEAPTILNEIKKLTQADVQHKHIGVLVRHNKDAIMIAEYLEGKGIPCVLLEALKDTRTKPPGDGVRVGTFDRSKGMEFTAVFLPRLGASRFPTPFVKNAPQQEHLPDLSPAELSEEEKEHRQLQLDRLYVGMTRAVQRLYLLADEDPCEELLNAKDYFDWQVINKSV